MAIQGIIPTAPGALANYDYTDVAAGVGYTNFFLGTTFANDVSGAHLLDNEFYSQQVYTGTTDFFLSGSVFLPINEVSFAVNFKLPRIIKGTAIANIPVGIYKTSADGDAFDSRIDITVHKISNGVGTEMGRASGATLRTPTSAQFDYAYNVDSLSIEIPFTHFKKGDDLILHVKQFGKGTDPSAPMDRTATYFIGHDPMGRATVSSQPRTFGTEPSIGTFKVPFKLDI